MRCDVAYEVGRLVREFTRSSRTILSSDSSDHSKHHRSERSVRARARAQHSVTACAQGVQLERKRRLVGRFHLVLASTFRELRRG